MYAKIITPDVIRQSLEWMGAPKPLRFKKWTSVLSSPDNTSLQQVWIELDRWQVHKWLRETRFSQGYPQIYAVVVALQECFCADVQVIAATNSPGENFVEVSLLLVVANDKAQ